MPPAPIQGTQPATGTAVAPPGAGGFRVDGRTHVHEASGMRFPDRVAGFTRDLERTLDIEGQYVAIGYSTWLKTGGLVNARISIVHLEDMTAKEHYNIIKGSLLRGMPNPSVIEEAKLRIERMPKADGYRGLFKSDDETAGLMTVNFGYWSARLRTIYPATESVEAQAAIRNLIETLDWTPLTRAPTTQ